MIFLCMHIQSRRASNSVIFISGELTHRTFPLLDLERGFLWHGLATLRHMEPQPLLSYVSKVPCARNRRICLGKCWFLPENAAFLREKRCASIIPSRAQQGPASQETSSEWQTLVTQVPAW